MLAETQFMLAETQLMYTGVKGEQQRGDLKR